MSILTDLADCCKYHEYRGGFDVDKFAKLFVEHMKHRVIDDEAIEEIIKTAIDEVYAEIIDTKGALDDSEY
ncbi:MAG: hypothetical protein NTY22_08075 [Proteobacteria bacterium]|nr:hypothetical protein [Pseudomonadota bacterium]